LRARQLQRELTSNPKPWTFNPKQASKLRHLLQARQLQRELTPPPPDYTEAPPYSEPLETDDEPLEPLESGNEPLKDDVLEAEGDIPEVGHLRSLCIQSLQKRTVC